ncbi:hypothetical protein [Streptomyces sp. NPDC018000]|uniref:hypothetical protein n=1 Tax=Streptomyces sp. NPDC018000 TaxID=3365028 RepID=UPI0037A0781C
MFSRGITDRVVEARARHDVRQLAAEGGEIRYGHIEIGGTYLYVRDAAEEIPWDEVTRVRVDDHQVGITVPHLRRRLEGIKLRADGRRENYRVGGDNTQYIESKDLSPCRKAIIWSVMSHIGKSLGKGKESWRPCPRAGPARGARTTRSRRPARVRCRCTARRP